MLRRVLRWERISISGPMIAAVSVGTNSFAAVGRRWVPLFFVVILPPLPHLSSTDQDGWRRQ